MKVLVSPVSLSEAVAVASGGADIIDIKNTSEGSLGANFPWVIQEVVGSLENFRGTFSATLGDLPYKPGTAALAALGAAYSGAKYIKAGLYGIRTVDEGVDMMRAVGRACRDFGDDITVVAAGYADFRSFGGLSPSDLVQAAARSGSDVVMVDTATKDGRDLFDHLEVSDIRRFIDDAHDAGLKVALAGSLKQAHLPVLFDLNPDVIGIRGAVCAGSNRAAPISAERVKSFMAAVRSRRALYHGARADTSA